MCFGYAFYRLPLYLQFSVDYRSNLLQQQRQLLLYLRFRVDSLEFRTTTTTMANSERRQILFILRLLPLSCVYTYFSHAMFSLFIILQFYYDLFCFSIISFVLLESLLFTFRRFAMASSATAECRYCNTAFSVLSRAEFQDNSLLPLLVFFSVVIHTNLICLMTFIFEFFFCLFFLRWDIRFSHTHTHAQWAVY